MLSSKTHWCWKQLCHFLFVTQHGQVYKHLVSQGSLHGLPGNSFGFLSMAGYLTDLLIATGHANTIYSKQPLISYVTFQRGPFTKKDHNKQSPGFQYKLSSPPTQSPTTTTTPSSKVLYVANASHTTTSPHRKTLLHGCDENKAKIIPPTPSLHSHGFGLLPMLGRNVSF